VTGNPEAGFFAHFDDYPGILAGLEPKAGGTATTSHSVMPEGKNLWGCCG
jgi:hypothetical protein